MCACVHVCACVCVPSLAGVGRRTATSLVAHMHGMRMFAPNVTRGSPLRNFYNDLKAVMQVAGVQGEEAVLYIEEHHVGDGAWG